jgi:hypothetical protein
MRLSVVLMAIVVCVPGCNRAPSRAETHTKSGNVAHMTDIFVALCHAVAFRPDLVVSNLVNVPGMEICAVTNVIQQSVDEETFGRLIFKDTWGNCFFFRSSKLHDYKSNDFNGIALEVSMWSAGPDGRNNQGKLDDVIYGPYDLHLRKQH